MSNRARIWSQATRLWPHTLEIYVPPLVTMPRACMHGPSLLSAAVPGPRLSGVPHEPSPPPNSLAGGLSLGGPFPLMAPIIQRPPRSPAVLKRGQLHTLPNQAESFVLRILGWPKATAFHPGKGRGSRAAREAPRLDLFCPAPRVRARTLPLYPSPYMFLNSLSPRRRASNSISDSGK